MYLTERTINEILHTFLCRVFKTQSVFYIYTQTSRLAFQGIRANPRVGVSKQAQQPGGRKVAAAAARGHRSFSLMEDPVRGEQVQVPVGATRAPLAREQGPGGTIGTSEDWGNLQGEGRKRTAVGPSGCDQMGRGSGQRPEVRPLCF